MIIGLAGRKQSGKNTVGKIIQILTYFSLKQIPFSVYTVLDFLQDKSLDLNLGPFKQMAFGDELKNIVCILIGCTREQLEDGVFKETPLGEEWHVMALSNKFKGNGAPLILLHEDWQKRGLYEQSMYHHQNMTPRRMLQLLGTECGRRIIHPNIWVNALMRKYVSQGSFQTIIVDFTKEKESYTKIGEPTPTDYPNWVITDVRFANEVKAIEERKGVIIRVKRKGLPDTDEHESETALDNYVIEHTIENNGSIEHLIIPTKQLLEKLDII